MVFALTLRSYNQKRWVTHRPFSCLYDTYLDVDFVTAENNGNVFTDTNKITVPVGNVLVCNSRSNIKHDNSTLTLNTIYCYLVSLSPNKIILLYLLTSNHHEDHQTFLDQRYPKCWRRWDQSWCGIGEGELRHQGWLINILVFLCSFCVMFYFECIRHLYLPTYLFSNSPVKWRLTKVVLPVPPSPTNDEEVNHIISFNFCIIVFQIYREQVWT